MKKETDILEREGKVRVIFSPNGQGAIYKKHPWIIPIERIGSEYITGQNLSANKMLGKEELTEEEKKKYPFVVNPTNFYRLRDFSVHDLSDPSSRVLINLALLSGRIAKSEVEFKKDPEKYYGWIDNPDIEAKDENAFYDLIYEAESFIREWPNTRYRELILFLNNKVKEDNFHISPDGISPERQRHGLIRIAKKYPDTVLACHPSKSPHFEEDLTILEMIHFGVLQKNIRGEIFFEGTFIGSSLDSVRTYLDKSGHESIRDTLLSQLRSKKGVSTPEEEARGNLSKKSTDTKLQSEFKNKMNAFRVALMDGKDSEADDAIDALRATYAKLESLGKAPHDQMIEIEQLYEQSKKGSKLEDYRKELKAMPLDKIHGRIRHHATPFQEEECKDVWEDKQALIEYMMKVKDND